MNASNLLYINIPIVIVFFQNKTNSLLCGEIVGNRNHCEIQVLNQEIIFTTGLCCLKT
jgi:hypothetical protein